MAKKDKPEAGLPVEQTRSIEERGKASPLVPDSEDVNTVVLSEEQALDRKVNISSINALEGNLSPDERSNLDAYLLDDALRGADFATSVLGLQCDRDIVQFMAVRDQAIKDLGVDTVYSRLLNDLILGQVHQHKACMRQAETSRNLVELCSENCIKHNHSPSFVEAVRYLSNYDEKIRALQTSSLRNMSTLFRMQNSHCRTHTNSMMKINAKTVNIGQQQVNVQVDGGQPEALPNQAEKQIGSPTIDPDQPEV